ncbi:MAG TPA: DUF6513 domain-containing protein [Lacipirellulaceae bacterium]|nr:DUF6513 domain-containing protein [Lacipirellulaceae bacterium]
MPREHVHFVTGRLAEHALRSVVGPLADSAEFDFSVDVLPITVAALMTPSWIAKHWSVPAAADRIVLPGYCEGDLAALQEQARARVERGPRDLRRLPEFFSREAASPAFGGYDIQIIAEINHCPRLSHAEILAQAAALVRDGADLIDVGCDPGGPWRGVGDVVRALRDAGHRVSIDSLNPQEISAAVGAGAELVLSVNGANRHAAAEWDAELVVTPDVPATLEGLDETLALLARAGARVRIDPILEPVGFGFAASLGRCLEVRRRYPQAEMMIGVGNLTELTDVDSAGVNALLIGFCQELGIRSVLTTQVINWSRTSVAECHAARQLMHYAVAQRVLPKHVDDRLIMLRDARIDETPPEEIAALAHQIRDRNFRIYASQGEVHLVSSELHLHHADPFLVMEQLRASGAGGAAPRSLDAGHAFYLGYEMCKAATALALGKTYVQDEPLNWGLATREEPRHYLRRRTDAGPAEQAGP